MRTYIVFFLAITSFSTSLGQSGDSSANLIRQGIALHDQKDYEGAIKLYDEVIKNDPNNYLAYYEKCLSLYVSAKYDDCIELCKLIIKKFPDEDDVRKVYSNYGSALDAQGKPEEALRVYYHSIARCTGQ